MPSLRTASSRTVLGTGLAAVALAAGAGSAHAATAASCGPVDVAPSVSGAGAAEEAVACLVDRERAAAGLAPLRDNAALRRAARTHSADMVRRQYYSHEAPGARGDLVSRLLDAAYDLVRGGENIATGNRTPAEVVDAWIASAPHCANVFDPESTEDGVGVDLGGTAGTSGPTWTHEFGRPKGDAAPGGAAPACPRGALPPDRDVAPFAAAAAPAAAPVPDVVADEAPAADAAEARVGLRATGRRRGRTLRLRIGVRGATDVTPVRVAVRQRGRTTRTTRYLSADRRVTVTVRLRSAARGRAVLTAGGVRRTVRFR